jgi:hypothetical protein
MEIMIDGNKVYLDEEDYYLFGSWTWRVVGGYLVRRTMGSKIWFHRLVNKTPEGLETDHINGNKLDNRKCNLRTVDSSQNQRNRNTKHVSNTGLKGINFYKKNGKYRVSITFRGKAIHIGYFFTIEEAKQAYDKAASQYFGEYANTHSEIEKTQFKEVKRIKEARKYLVCKLCGEKAFSNELCQRHYVHERRKRIAEENGRDFIPNEKKRNKIAREKYPVKG